MANSTKKFVALQSMYQQGTFTTCPEQTDKKQEEDGKEDNRWQKKESNEPNNMNHTVALALFVATTLFVTMMTSDRMVKQVTFQDFLKDMLSQGHVKHVNVVNDHVARVVFHEQFLPKDHPVRASGASCNVPAVCEWSSAWCLVLPGAARCCPVLPGAARCNHSCEEGYADDLLEG